MLSRLSRVCEHISCIFLGVSMFHGFFHRPQLLWTSDDSVSNTQKQVYDRILWGYVLNFEVATAKVHKMLLRCTRGVRKRFRNLRGSWHSKSNTLSDERSHEMSNSRSCQMIANSQALGEERGMDIYEIYIYIWTIWNMYEYIYIYIYLWIYSIVHAHIFFWTICKSLSRFLNWAQLSKKRRAHTVRRTSTAIYWLQLTVFESQPKHWRCLLETV